MNQISRMNQTMQKYVGDQQTFFPGDICSFTVDVLTVSRNLSSERKMRKALSGLAGLELQIKRLKGLKHTATFSQ